MNPSPLSPGAFAKSAMHMSGTIAKVAISVTPKGFSNTLAQLTLASVVLYIFLSAVGSNAGFFSNGLSKSVKDYSQNMIPFFVIAWAYMNRNYGTINYLGLFAGASFAYIALDNLPLSASTPNWLVNVKTGAVTVFEGLMKGGVVATALSLHA